MLESYCQSRSPSLQAFLDSTAEQILKGHGRAATASLVKYLHQVRLASGSHDLHELSKTCRSHRIHELLAEDPFTQRCRQRPRGYAGDAVTLDYIYTGLSDDLTATVSEVGQQIFACTAGDSGSAEAVRDRRDLLAREIDEVASRGAARVLSVACGHLREALISQAIRSGSVTELVALDQDDLSLHEVRRYELASPITTLKSGVSDLLKRRLSLGRFDLIYSAGLYDYLSPPVAKALTSELLTLLNPGGRLLLANFVEGFATQTYMEVFMDWHLIARSRDEMTSLLDPAVRATASHAWHDDGYVVYLRAQAA